jgi:hypothetical protein
MKGKLPFSLAIAGILAGLALLALGYVYGRAQRPSQQAVDTQTNAQTLTYLQREAQALSAQSQRDQAEMARISAADAPFNAGLWVVVVGGAILIIGGAAAIVRVMWRKGSLIYAREGLFPLLRESGLGGKAVLDPNRMASPATRIERPGLTRQAKALLVGQAGEGGFSLTPVEMAAPAEQMQITTQSQFVQLAAAGGMTRNPGRMTTGDGVYGFPGATPRQAIPPVEVIEIGEHNLSHIQRLLGEPEEDDRAV